MVGANGVCPDKSRETFRNDPKQSFAGIGGKWVEELKDFVGPSPYPSWILDENGQWQPPAPKPESSTDEYVWNESRENGLQKVSTILNYKYIFVIFIYWNGI